MSVFSTKFYANLSQISEKVSKILWNIQVHSSSNFHKLNWKQYSDNCLITKKHWTTKEAIQGCSWKAFLKGPRMFLKYKQNSSEIPTKRFYFLIKMKSFFFTENRLVHMSFFRISIKFLVTVSYDL